MKKILTIALSALLILALLAGCGSPTDVFEKSKNADSYTLTIEKGKTYTYESFSFELDKVADASKLSGGGGGSADGSNVKDSVNNITAQGKWVVAVLDMVDGDVTGDLLEQVVRDEMILLNGAAPKTQDLITSFSAGMLGSSDAIRPSSYQLYVYFDVPGRFDTEQAVVTGSDKVKVETSD